MIRIARFWSFSSRPLLKSRDSLEYWKCGRIKELYNIRRMSVGKKFFKRHMVPCVVAILLDILCMCGFQLRFSSIVSPKKLNSVTLSTGSQFIFKVGVIVFIFIWWWWKIIYFVLLTFRDNLFIFNHSWMFLSSVLICSGICLKSSLSQENDELKEHSGLIKFVSSAYRIISNFSLAMWISFMQIKNKRGPRMDGWGTTVFIKVVSEHVPSNSTNCCLSNK